MRMKVGYKKLKVKNPFTRLFFVQLRNSLIKIKENTNQFS